MSGLRAALNGYWESMNDDGRRRLLYIAEVAADANMVRVHKNAGGLRAPAEVEEREASQKGTGRPKATAILAGCASLVTIFTWIGITSRGRGQSVYDALCIAWPFLVAGLAFLAGWNLKEQMGIEGA